jgi:hypothetical protein
MTSNLQEAVNRFDAARKRGDKRGMGHAQAVIRSIRCAQFRRQLPFWARIRHFAKWGR